MRGKPHFSPFSVGFCRITPADAGKTPPAGAVLSGRQDHPRGCGENRGPAQFFRFPLGSPPRMRGKRPGAHPGRSDSRITPADAGKTASSVPLPAKKRDHPRGCGENNMKNPTAKRKKGSPPRMRGKRFDDLFKIIGYRITPADAGKTQSDGRGLLLCRDHPRGCGENSVSTPPTSCS